MCVVTAYGLQCCMGEKIRLVLSSFMYVRSFVGVMVCVCVCVCVFISAIKHSVTSSSFYSLHLQYCYIKEWKGLKKKWEHEI
jgi:hypothetical protein